MNGKRFACDYPDGSDIWDNGHYFALANSPKEAKKIVELLNHLYEENDELNQRIKELEEKNENLLAKLKYTCEQINYSERLREMMK